MAQPQREADVHQDELCPPNKRYALMDANKKIDLDNPLYNHHERFVAAPKFSEMVPFFLNDLGFTLELRSPSKFKTTGLVRYCFVNNVHVDYADLLWEGLHYSLKHPSTLIRYLGFTKIIARKNKAGVGMKIPSWMITNEMKLIKNFQMYVAVFGVDVPTTQSQPIESTQGTHRTTSALRTPNPDKSLDELEAKQNVENVEEHLIIEEIEKFVEGTKNVENVKVDNFISHSQNDLGTWLEPRSNMESPKVEITIDVSQPVNVIKEEDESAEDDYDLRRREKGSRKKFHVLAQHLQEVMEELLPKMADARVKELTKTQVLIYVAQGLIMERQQSQADVAKMIAEAI
ncbi:hypothetical protein Tco_0475533 [Tanacetum coccineum]